MNTNNQSIVQPLQNTNSCAKIDLRRKNRVRLYFQMLNHFKGILDAWWRLQFDDLPPKKEEQ